MGLWVAWQMRQAAAPPAFLIQPAQSPAPKSILDGRHGAGHIASPEVRECAIFPQAAKAEGREAAMFKKLRLATLTLLLGSCGCSTMSNTEGGTLLGAGTGAALGAAIGRNPMAAVVGGIGGALVGNVIGHNADRNEQRARVEGELHAQAIHQAQRQLSKHDIIQMTREHQPTEIILNQIRTTNSVYELTADDLRELGANGVNQAVIIEMQNRSPRRLVRMTAPPPVVIVEEPAPRVSVGVGVGRRWR